MISHGNSRHSLPASIQHPIDDFYSSSMKEDCEGVTAFRGGSPRKKECELLSRLVLDTRPAATLDWGLGDGAATIAIVLARREIGASGLHVSLDPFQHSISKDVGLIQLERHGVAGDVDFREDRSAEFLVHANQEGRQFDFIFVDGDHSVGGKVADAYLADMVLKPGGLIAFHDALFKSTAAAVTWLATDRGYRILSLVSESSWKVLARCGRHLPRLGVDYAFRAIPNLGISIAALQKPSSK